MGELGQGRERFALALPAVEEGRPQLPLALAGRASALLAFADAPADGAAARTIRVERDGTVYRVLVGNGDRVSAQALARELERLLDRPTTLVQR